MPTGYIHYRKISGAICCKYMENSLVMENYGYERKINVDQMVVR